MAADSPSPLLKADAATLVMKAEKDGTVRVSYSGWEDAKVLLGGEGLLVRWGDGQVQAYRVGGGGPPMEEVDELAARQALTGIWTDVENWGGGALTAVGASEILEDLTTAGFKIVRAKP